MCGFFFILQLLIMYVYNILKYSINSLKMSILRVLILFILSDMNLSYYELIQLILLMLYFVSVNFSDGILIFSNILNNIYTIYDS